MSDSPHPAASWTQKPTPTPTVSGIENLCATGKKVEQNLKNSPATRECDAYVAGLALFRHAQSELQTAKSLIEIQKAQNDFVNGINRLAWSGMSPGKLHAITAEVVADFGKNDRVTIEWKWEHFVAQINNALGSRGVKQLSREEGMLQVQNNIIRRIESHRSKLQEADKEFQTAKNLSDLQNAQTHFLEEVEFLIQFGISPGDLQKELIKSMKLLGSSRAKTTEWSWEDFVENVNHILRTHKILPLTPEESIHVIKNNFYDKMLGIFEPARKRALNNPRNPDTRTFFIHILCTMKEEGMLPRSIAVLIEADGTLSAIEQKSGLPRGQLRKELIEAGIPVKPLP